VANALSEPHYRGFTRYIIGLMRGFRIIRPDDLEVVLVSDVPIHDNWTRELSDFEACQFQSSSRLLWRHVTLPRFLRSNDFDLIHVPTNLGAPMVCSIPTVFTIHDNLTHDELVYSAKRLRSLRELADIASHRIVLRNSRTHVLTVSRTSYESVLQRKWVPPDRVMWMYNGVDVVRPTREREPGLLIYVGGLEERKNVSSLLAALPHILAAHRHVKLEIVGTPTSEIAALRTAAESMGVDHRVRWRGYITDGDLADLYSSADMIVIPSLAEGFGLPAAEAMAAGCIPVVSRSTALEEVVGDTSLCFEPRDPQDIARVVSRTLDRRDVGVLRTRLIQRASAEFSWPRHAQVALSLYRSARCA
jgi:glycosyltransferase involved in cell wall biosynthesis